MILPLLNELEKANTVLIAGAGGGFDVFCGLPLYFWLKKAGKTVHLANLSSGALAFCDATNPDSGTWRRDGNRQPLQSISQRCICPRGSPSATARRQSLLSPPVERAP